MTILDLSLASCNVHSMTKAQKRLALHMGVGIILSIDKPKPDAVLVILFYYMVLSETK